MKWKTIISSALALTCAFGINTAAVSADTGTASDPADTAASEQAEDTSKTVTLTLEEAVQKMKTDSPSSRQAELNHSSDLVAIKSKGETIHQYNEEQDQIKASGALVSGTVSKTDTDIARLSRDFVQNHLEDNYNAEMNSIEESAVSQYYTILINQKNVTQAASALEYQKKLTSSCEVKYRYGIGTKEDLLTQQTAQLNAETALADARTTLDSSIRSFNQALGYDLDTELVLSTPIEKTEEELPSAEDTISKALAENLDLKYYTEVYVPNLQKQMNHLRYTVSTNSAAYKNAELTYNKALESVNNMPTEREQTIRSAYDSLSALDNQIALAEDSQKTAERTLNNIKTMYSHGLATALDISQAQMNLDNTVQTYASLMVKYNEALLSIQHMAGVGSQRVTYS